jgi:pheromone shutdown protein TraB
MRHITDKITRFGFYEMAGLDTAFVLFFLAMEYGRSARMLSLDSVLMAVTMVMLIVLPYFLPCRYEKPLLGNWLIGRSALALCGVVLGVGFKQSIGVVLPESIRFMPMTFLILVSMVSCYIQFYGMVRLRATK